MSRHRPGWPVAANPGQTSRWSKGYFGSLPFRVGLVVAAAAVPTIVVVAMGNADTLRLVISISAGVGLALIGIEHVVTRPLRAMRDAVDSWRRGAPFELPEGHSLPGELRGLGLSFKRATRTLSERESQLKVAHQRQELAMQEIHHRVKNNLQIVASLLNLQASRIKLPEVQAEFQSARDRVRALAIVHRHLYAHGEVHTINMRSFLLELCEQLFQAMGETVGERLVLEIDAPEVEMSSDQAVPLSLIVTEAVTNAIKYAYPAGRRGAIGVQLQWEGEFLVLEIRDDGIGIPAGRAETASGSRDGIGIQLMTGFARQLGAKLEVEQGAGTRYRVPLKLRRERLDGAALSISNGAALRGQGASV